MAICHLLMAVSAELQAARNCERGLRYGCELYVRSLESHWHWSILHSSFEVIHRPTVMLGSRFAVSRGSVTRTFCTAAEPAKVKASRRLKDNRPLLIQQRAKNAELEASQKASGLEWRVLSAT